MLHQPEVQFSQRLAHLQNGSENSHSSIPMQRMRPGKLQGGEGDRRPQEQLTAMLAEKWNQFKKDRDEAKLNFQKYHMKKFKYLMQALFLFIGGTLMYSVHNYLVPYVWGNLDGWTRYYIKVFLTYVGIMTTANWLCAILYQSAVPITKDRPELQEPSSHIGRDYFSGQLSLENGTNNDITGDEKGSGLVWKFCKYCSRMSPPRSRHCRYCKTCILKRDHHCFMLGTCIGFRNQRYFIVFLCYMMVCCAVGLPTIITYIRGNFPDYNYSDLFLPVTLYRTAFGDLDPRLTLMVLHASFLAGYFPLASVQLLSQITALLDGRTPHEIVKKVPIRDTLTLRKRTETVFGSFWMLNFLFPAQLFFRQEGDGKSWPGVKMDSGAAAAEEV